MSERMIDLLPVEYDVLLALLNDEIKTSRLKFYTKHLNLIKRVLIHNKKVVCEKNESDKT